MTCPNCGTELPEGSKFCTNCGSKMEMNDTQQINKENSFEEDESTEIIFDKELPKDRLKKGNKNQNIITIIAFIVVIGAASAAFILNNQSNKKKLAEQAKKGIENVEGLVKYNKGNKEYAKDELIEYNGNYYYFDNKENMFKGKGEGEWVQIKNDWYFVKNDGTIATKGWVDNEMYYVDEYGKMLKNTRTPDGCLVDENGKYVDEKALKAAAEYEAALKAIEEAKKKQETTGSYKSVQPITTQPIKSGEVISIDTSKEFWIQSYETYNDYTAFDDDTNVDITIKIPVFGGQNSEEVTKINDCINNYIDDMVSIADGKINEEEKPRKYQITTAEIANIDSNKVNVVLKGKLERSGKAARDIRIRFIYDRSSGTGYVND